MKKIIEIDISEMTENNIDMLKFHLNGMGMKFKEFEVCWNCGIKEKTDEIFCTVCGVELNE